MSEANEVTRSQGRNEGYEGIRPTPRASAQERKEAKMNLIINTLLKLGIRKDELDYHFIRASMVIIFLFFGYQKWFEYEAQALIPYISHGPLIFWLYPVFGLRGATWFLGVAEWTFGALLLAGFWNKKLGILGALGSCFSFIATVTIIPFIPNGWAPSAGGFPAMTETVAFLLKDLVLLAVSVYLLRQDVIRVILSERSSRPASTPFQPDMNSLGVTRGQ
jgi:uncharacterized membrane protein YkgB